jgi:flagellar FliL protein
MTNLTRTRARRGDTSPSAPNRRPVKIILLVAVPAVAMLLGGGWLFATGRLTPLLELIHGETASSVPAPPPQPVYADLPAILIDVRAAGGREAYLKLDAALELANASAKPFVEAEMPVIVDSFNVELWNLPLDDLKDPAAVDSLRSDLLAQIDLRLKPVVVKDILFKDMVISMV